MLKRAGLIIIVCLLTAAASLNGALAAEKDVVWEKMVRAKADFQNRLAELLIDAVPEARELILIQRDMQLTLIEMRSRKYYYLLDNDPSRLVRTGGYSRLSNFEWTDRDEAELLRTDESYSSLEGRREELEERNLDHPMWPKLRESLPSALSTEEYLEIVKSLASSMDEVDSMLLE